MHQLPIEQQVLLVLEILGLLVLCLRLWREGLYRIYPYFFSFLALELCQTLIPVLVPLRSRLYRDLFVTSQALIVVFEALVVLELYKAVLGKLEGISRIVQRYVRITLGLAVVVALLLLRLENNTATMTGYVFAFQRTVLSTLVVFVLLISGFLVYYPVPLGRNVIAYMVGYAIYFLVANTASLIQDLGYFWIRLLGSVDMAVFAGCILLWLLMLDRQGEAKRVVVGHQWDHADEGRLLAQLEAINASLLRFGRK
jgi:hypothetical protein